MKVLASELWRCRCAEIEPEWKTSCSTSSLLRPRQGSEVLWWPCLFVCLSASISLELPIFTNFFLCTLPSVYGSVLLWRRRDMLYTSGFMDDVSFVYTMARNRRRLNRERHGFITLAYTQNWPTRGSARPGRSLMSTIALLANATNSKQTDRQTHMLITILSHPCLETE